MPIPTPHISAKQGDFARTVLMPGDPLRSEFIARTYLTDPVLVNDIRGVHGYTGTWHGKRISVMASGMGQPSIGIYSYELFEFYGVESIIRIGSCGALQPGIRIGDLILAQGAVRDEGTSAAYVSRSYPAVSDAEMLCLCQEAAAKTGITTHTGIVRSHDSFYVDGQDAINEHWSGRGILGSDMETAALLTVAGLRGVKALSILNNVVLWGNDTFHSIGAYSEGNTDGAGGEKASILLALETFAAIDRKEKQK